MAAIEKKDHLCRTIDISPRIIPVLRKRVNAVLSVDCQSQNDYHKVVPHPSQPDQRCIPLGRMHPRHDETPALKNRYP